MRPTLASRASTNGQCPNSFCSILLWICCTACCTTNQQRVHSKSTTTGKAHSKSTTNRKLCNKSTTSRCCRMILWFACGVLHQLAYCNSRNFTIGTPRKRGRPKILLLNNISISINKFTKNRNIGPTTSPTGYNKPYNKLYNNPQ